MVYRNDVAIAMTLGSAAGVSQGTYSTEEVRIGTWIDGKPLYRRVVDASPVKSLNMLTDIYTVPNDQNIVYFDSYVRWGNYSDYNLQPIPTASYTDSGTTQYFSIYNMRKPHVFKAKTNGNGWINQTVVIIMYYTKTSDSAASEITVSLPSSVEASGSDAKSLT